MNIILNGSPRDVPDNLTAGGLIVELGLTHKRLALEVNQQIVPRSTFETHLIRPEDNIEIVQAIGGG
ncbi:MAG: sulfur carrier protein ThiS [Gammaproteobacteria bacterium]|nr:sulfur carrier protein ThiS [Gammaproteobacteria bacterium]MDH3560462.1 sulfur carrier protein ThiS [Gammaproteobacteria bacterium]